MSFTVGNYFYEYTEKNLSIQIKISFHDCSFFIYDILQKVIVLSEFFLLYLLV